MKIAKMTDGKIVEIVKVRETVGFSNDKGWVLVCFDIGKKNTCAVKWFPISTYFVWVRDIINF